MTNTTSANKAPKSILDHLLAAPLAEISFPLVSRVSIRERDGSFTEALALGADNGNDAMKLAVFADNGRLVTLRIPTAYMEAERVQAGGREITYTVGGESFWIGEVALRHEAGALPIGPTDQRLPDPRMLNFIGACIVEVLTAAGFTPGAHQIALGFAVPNAEIELDERGDKLGVCEQTRKALKDLLSNRQWNITRTDAKNHSADWKISVRGDRLLPQAQSVGTYTVYTKAPNGTTVSDLDAMTVIDIGGGDLYLTDIQVKPYQMASRRLGDGTIAIARALQRRFPNAELNDVAAQQALITRKMLVSGRNRDIGDEVDQVIGTKGQDIIGKVLPALRQTRRFVLITGGGTILLRDPLKVRLETTGKQQGQDYEVINRDLSSQLNSIGALFSLLFKVAAAKRG